MDMVPVSSSQISAIGYDQETMKAHVRFVDKGNGGALYEYDDVPKSTIDAVMGADSVGKAFNLLMKYGFNYRRIE